MARPTAARADKGLSSLLASRKPAWWQVAAVTVALVPAVRMTWWVLQGTPVHFTDYWLIFDGLYTDSGRPGIRDLVTPYNGHLMVLPKLVYWLNVLVFAGSNITLGLFVVLLGLAQAVLLWRLVPRDRATARAGTAAVVVAAGAALFAPHGAWSFLRSMSGAAWLLANALAVAAVVVRARGHRLPALGLALLAAMSYGSGLMAFPAVLVTAAAVDRRIPWRDWPVAAAGAAVAVWYEVAASGQTTAALARIRPGPWEMARGALALVGGISPTDPGVAEWVGGAVLVCAGVLVGLAWRGADRRTAAWFGILAYGVGCAGTIAYGRVAFTSFTDSRYSSIAALVWIPVLALWVVVAGRLRTAALPVLVVAAALAVGGTDKIDETRSLDPLQHELSIAFRVGVADGGTRWIGLGLPMPPVSDRMREMGHHPYDGSPACAAIGQRIAFDPAGGVGALDGQVTPFTEDPGVPRGSVATGFVRGEPTVACVAVVDREGTVVGLGTSGWPRLRLDGDASDDGIRALAPSGAGDVTVVVRLRDREGFVALRQA